MASGASSSSSSTDSDNIVGHNHIAATRKRKRDESAEITSTGVSEVDNVDVDDPVLSHAARRKEKKRQKVVEKAEPISSDFDGKNRSPTKNAVSGSEDRKTKRMNSVWVGNLSFKTTAESLKEFFRDLGEITRVHMPTKPMHAGNGGKGMRGENRGFAYVDFVTSDAKIVAITYSERHLDGRRLLIKDGDDFSGRPTDRQTALSGNVALPPHTFGQSKTARKILTAQTQPQGPTLFFGNLGFEATEERLRAMLDAHRPRQNATEDPSDTKQTSWIRKIRLGTFEDSGNCKGWAFVDFTTNDHATAALTNPRNHHLDGRDLKVEYASPDAVRRGGGGTTSERIIKSRPQKMERNRLKSEGDGKSPRDVDKIAGEREKNKTFDRPRPLPPHIHERGKVKMHEHSITSVNALAVRSRPRPGAALAMAKRESAAIVASQGERTKF